MLNERVKSLRIKNKLSQEELAGLAGIHQSTVSKIERGNRKVDAEEIIKIAGALGVMPSALLDDPQQMLGKE